MRILIVEDDPLVGARLKRELQDEGHAVDWVRNRPHAEAALNDRLNVFHVALLDWGLARMTGMEVLRSIRKAGNNIPVLIITARDAVDDRVRALDEGADDFLVKPFELAELKARLRALARRHAGRIEPALRTPWLVLDPSSHCVQRDGRSIQLTSREYALLHALMQRPGALLSRSQLESHIYGWEKNVESNAVEFLLHNLRQKVGPEQIENVRGIGWRVASGS